MLFHICKTLFNPTNTNDDKASIIAVEVIPTTRRRETGILPHLK